MLITFHLGTTHQQLLSRQRIHLLHILEGTEISRSVTLMDMVHDWTLAVICPPCEDIWKDRQSLMILWSWDKVPQLQVALRKIHVNFTSQRTSTETVMPIAANSAQRYLKTYGTATMSRSPPFESRPSTFRDGIPTEKSAPGCCRC